MPTSDDFQDDRPPAYGQPTRRIDPTAEPPRYSLLEPAGGTPTAPPSAHFARSRLQDRDLVQEGEVIRHWQREQRREATAEERCKSLLYRTNLGGKKKPWYKLTWKRSVIVIVVLLITFIAIGIGVRLSRRKGNGSDNFTYDDVYVGTPLAVTTGSFRPDDQVSLYFYQTNDSMVSMTTETGPDLEHQIFRVNDAGVANGTGIAHVIRNQSATFMQTSLFYVDDAFRLQERKSMNGPNGWGSVTGKASTWTPGTLGRIILNEVSHEDMNLATSFDPLDQVFENDTTQCTDEGGIVSLFYRPVGNATSIQELIRSNKATNNEAWTNGSVFSGARAGSQMVTLVTPAADAGSNQSHIRWLYALDEQGRLLEWSCRDCCANTSSLWRQSPQPYALPGASTNNTMLSGQIEDNKIALYYRSDTGTIWKALSPIPPLSNSGSGAEEPITPSVFPPNNTNELTTSQRPWTVAVNGEYVISDSRELYQDTFSQLWYTANGLTHKLPTGPPTE